MQVNFHATLRAAVGTKTVDLATPAGASVLELVHEIARRWPVLADRILTDDDEISRQVHVMIGGRNIRWLAEGSATTLRANDVVDLFPPTAGG